MSEIINYTRLTSSDKLQDRFLTCQVYSPLDPEQAESGMIFSQIEILNSWFPTSQIGQTIINTLIREYYRGTKNDKLENFEDAVKKVNESLAQIAQSGETDWIGKLNGVLALFVGDKVHLAQTGQSKAYLFRSNKANFIADGSTSDESPHPLKTFSNIISGTIEKSDKIIIGNQTFYNTIEPNELVLIASSYRPAISALECAKVLRRQNVNQANAIFIELTDKDDLADIPPDQKIETIYIDKAGFSLKHFFRDINRSYLKPITKIFIFLFSNVKDKSSKTISPAIGKFVEKTQQKTKETYQKIQSKVEDKNSRSEIISAQQPNNPDSKLELPSNISTKIKKLKNKLRRELIKAGVYSKKKSKMILLILVPILIIFVLTITYSLTNASKANQTKEDKTSFQSIEETTNIILAAELKNDQSNILGLYKQAVATKDKIKDQTLKNKSEDILDKAKNKIFSITKTSQLKLTTTKEIGAPISNFVTLNDQAYVFDDQNNLYKQQGENYIKISSRIHKNKTIRLASDENNIYILDDKKQLTSFNLKKLASESESVGIAEIGPIKIFSDNAYILNQGQNQIWKIPSNDLAQKSEYIKDSIAITGSVDMAIDGSIYLLNNDGMIKRLSRGKEIGEIEIQLPLSEKINYKYLFTNEETTNFLVIGTDESGIRIVIIGKDGEVVRQLQISDFGKEMINVHANNDLTKLFIANTKTINTYDITID